MKTKSNKQNKNIMKTEINKMEIVDGVLLSIENAQGEVIIPNEVTGIWNNVFNQKHEVTAVRGENVTGCGDYNFSCNVNLSKISLPKLTTCRGGNFLYNAKLAEISLPNLESCGNENFCHNANLVEINLPKLGKCGNWNFSDNVNLVEIALPNLRTCGNDNFLNNDNLKEISLPNLGNCGNKNFNLTAKLEEITLPSLKNCGDGNFQYNAKLVAIALPNLAKCGDWNFQYNANLVEIALPNLAKCGNENFRNNANLSKINGQKVVCIDGITGVLISKKGNVFKTKALLKVENNELVTKEEVTYIVSDGNGNYAHGATIQEAKADLIYKIVGRNADEYQHLTMDSILTHEESITCYRTITGACAYGTKEFVENILNGNKKEKYTIKEICTITENHYGSETFKNFFKK